MVLVSNWPNKKHVKVSTISPAMPSFIKVRIFFL